ncbi:MAG TPA: outer membrane protein assembly factor BamB [Accumulibacter sp.]|nr:outer membrane protein assembly factor BamB [Accumulibacter sp.]HMW17187.1 outer membrane protein assembly factor BamB [Accumulibacter sp.]HMX22005.1 outer membrane protein assembly factor BamB [Accumulibacter sp.]HNC18281.1 outer membrane protein assembly factor BamB [Accumulibacter sp.]HND80869.1 outer membrane protein assembly factor BamB [Accumulibacter sp.]
MNRSLSAVAGVMMLTLSACSTLESLNPFASRGPKIAEPPAIETTISTRVLWETQVGKSGGFNFTPAIVGSAVYAAAHDGTVARFDEGQTVWKINAGQSLTGGVGADANLVVVGTAKGEVLAFASSDGRPLWKARASSEIVAPPALALGMVIVRSGDHRLTAYDAFEGKRKWVYKRPTPPLSVRTSAAPLVVDNFVFAGFPGGKLIAVSVDNGAPLWEGTVALPKGATELDRVADITSVPVIDGRTVCAAAYQGRVACFDLGSGSLIWARDISSAAGLTIDGRYVFVSDDKGTVHALDKSSGASLWKQDKLFLRRLSAPVSGPRWLAVADLQGMVHFLRHDDGAFVARLTTDGSAVVAPPQHQNDRLIVQTSGGRVLAIEGS